MKKLITIRQRATPTCGRDDCDPKHTPEHWVDVEIDEKAVTKLCETVFDLAQLWWGKALAYAGVPEDSREMFRLTLDWAKEFEATFTDEPEYMSEIERFFERKYQEWEES